MAAIFRRPSARRLGPPFALLVIALPVALLTAAVLIGTVGCAKKSPTSTIEPTPPTPPTPPSPPTPPPPAPPSPPSLSFADLGAALYPSRYVEGGTQLEDGVYTDFAKMLEVRLLDEPLARADLDGDGDLDAAVLVSSNTGGSATFYDLVVVENVDGEPQAVDSVHLGDRLEVESLELAAGRVNVAYLVHGPDDAMCCPSQKERRAWKVDSGKLVPVER